MLLIIFFCDVHLRHPGQQELPSHRLYILKKIISTLMLFTDNSALTRVLRDAPPAESVIAAQAFEIWNRRHYVLNDEKGK